MKILLICNNAYVKGNGICTAVQSLLTRLRNSGVDAKLLSTRNPDPKGKQPDFPMRHFKFPIFEPIVYANGFCYAEIDDRVLEDAISWADVVHVLEAFPLEVRAVNIAEKLNKPVVATFHLFPENITANLGISWIKFINNTILNIWRRNVFDKCSYIQCPTEFVKNHLLCHGFKSNLRVITNGIEIPSQSEHYDETRPVKILCTGRYSNEKGQLILLRAMRYSKHSQEIQLLFAGKGPVEKKYKRVARKLVEGGILKYPPVFGFYDSLELAQLVQKSYLYIHCAWVEVEGLSCIEAISHGVIPIISKGGLSGTSQFALDERSVFPAYDSKALAEKIDWWIEHKEEHDIAMDKYLMSAGKYDQKCSTQRLIEMYLDAMNPLEKVSILQKTPKQSLIIKQLQNLKHIFRRAHAIKNNET